MTRIDLPDGFWELALMPRDGWQSGRSGPYVIFAVLFWMAGTALALVIGAVAWHRERLEQLVRRRTTDLILSRDQAEQRSRELSATNDELERFAHVAAHDLQEPLRMVTSYTALLGKRYKGRLDADADTFIGFAAEGAARMSRLLNELQVYTSVRRAAPSAIPVAVAQALRGALADLGGRIAESGAVVLSEALPVVLADERRLRQVFAILIDNAVEYRDAGRVPRVQVAAECDGAFWRLSVRDNGIGIESQYFARIFLIFQRLHRREEHAGMGIGLAVARKIIESFGGRIWVESEPGVGSTFHFTLPTSPCKPPIRSQRHDRADLHDPDRRGQSRRRPAGARGAEGRTFHQRRAYRS
jgi:light-regulated signal transduction histidine kinase (bacteriophytochrome)